MTNLAYGHDICSIAQIIVDRQHSRKTSVTILQLIKLVYLCHCYMLAYYNRPLVKQEFEAWKFGPNQKKLYNSLKRSNKNGFIYDIDNGFPIFLDNDESLIINNVLNGYGKMDGVTLSSQCNNEGSPWAITISYYSIIYRFFKNPIISNDIISGYYKSKIKKEESKTNE